jgi:serine/threonine protein kinase
MPKKKEVKKEEGFTREQYLKSLETRLPGGKKTKRLPVLKLELGEGVPLTQLDIISNSVYNLGDLPPEPSREFQNWRVIDEKLYGDAKEAYDGTIAPFKKQPRVYKLESIKHKVWEGTRDKTAELEAQAEAEYLARKAKLDAAKAKMAAKKKAQAAEAAAKKGGADGASTAGGVPMTGRAKNEFEGDDEKNIKLPPLTLEEQLDTHLDPFEPPAPWYKEWYKGELTYFNGETLERRKTKPGTDGNPTDLIFGEKLQMLTQLTPRADLDGFEYREIDEERRRRQRYMKDFDLAMQEEIKRREENPTDMEIIEDCLFDLVDGIVQREEREEKMAKKREKHRIMQTWHVLCRGYRMKELPIVAETEDGEIDREVTDAEFVDILISWTGHMLALQTPPGLFEGHEAERAEARSVEDEKRRFEEYERNKPLIDKMRVVLALARTDPKAAARKVYKGLKERALAPVEYIKVKENRRYMALYSKQMVLQGLFGMIQASKTPKTSAMLAAKAAYASYKQTFFADDPNEAANEAALDAIMAQLDGVVREEVKEDEETEAERKLRLWRASQPKPAKIADAVLVTMTIMVEPPEPYKWKRPRNWKDDVGDVRQKAKETASDLKWMVMPLVPKAIDTINEINAVIGSDAIEIEEEPYQVPKEVKHRQKVEIKPWEVLDRPEQSVDTRPAYRHGKTMKALLNIDLTPEELKEEEERAAATASGQMKEELDEGNGDATAEAKKSKKKKKSADEGETIGGEAASPKKSKKKSKKKAAGAEGENGEKEEKPPAEEYTDFLDDTTNLNELPTTAKNRASTAKISAGETDNAEGNVAVDTEGNEQDEFDVDDRKSKEYLSMLRSKTIEDDPEAYERRKLVVPKVPLLLTAPLTVEIPTTAEIKDTIRESIRKVVEPKHVKDIMDPSERKRFEAMAIEEVAEAACLPVERVHIEAIRRLPPNDAKLVALQTRNDDFMQSVREKEEEEADFALRERERKKALMNPQTYGVEPEMVESLRDFVEDASERLGYDPDEMVNKMGLTKENVTWKRYDRDFEITLDGTLVPAGTAARRTLAMTQRTNRQHEQDDAEANRDRIILDQDFLEPEDQDVFEECYDIYEGICDKIQAKEDERLVALEKMREEEQEEERHQNFVSDLVRDYRTPVRKRKNGKFTKPSKLSFEYALCYKDMVAEVYRRDCEERQIDRDQKAMWREDLQSRLPGETEVTDSIEELVEGVVEFYERERQIACEEIELRERLEKEEYENEFNYKIHGNPNSALETMHTEKIDEYYNKTLMNVPKRPAYFKLGITNPEDLKHDTKYWLYHDMKPLDAKGRRQRRIKYLRKRKDERMDVIQQQIAAVQKVRSIAMYDAREYYDEELEPIVEGVIRPMARMLKVRIAYKAKEIASDLMRKYNKKRKRFMKYLRGGKEEHELEDEEVERMVGAAKKQAHTEMMIRRLSDKRWEEELDEAETARRVAFKQAMLLENAAREGLMYVWEAYEGLADSVEEAVGEILVSPEEANKWRAPLYTEDDESTALSLTRYLNAPAPSVGAGADAGVDAGESIATGADDPIIAPAVGAGEDGLHQFTWDAPAPTQGEGLGLESSDSPADLQSSSLAAMGDSGSSLPPSGGTTELPGQSEIIPAPPVEQQKADGGAQEGKIEEAEFENKPVDGDADGDASVEQSSPVVMDLFVGLSVEERRENLDMRMEDPCPNPYEVSVEGAIDFSYELFHGPTDAAEEIIFECVDAAVDLVEADRQAGQDAIDEAWVVCIHDAVYAVERQRAEHDRVDAFRLNMLGDRLAEQTGFDKIWNVLDRVCKEVTRVVKLEETKRGRMYFDPEKFKKREDFDINETEDQARERMQREAELRAAEEALAEDLRQEELAAARMAELEAKEKADEEKAAAAEAEQNAEKNMHAHYRRLKRKRVKEGLEFDVVDALDKMCIACELAAEFEEPPMELYPQVEDDYDLEMGKAETESVSPEPDDMEQTEEALEGVDPNVDPDAEGMEGEEEEEEKEAEPVDEDELPKPLMGCEISFMIQVKPEDREGEGLSGLNSEDIAIMLQDQVMQVSSQLKKGYIGARVLDVQYKMPFQKRSFDTWEDYWVHIIHPAFFYRGIGKRISRKNEGRKDGRLASGLLMHNPTSEFSERSKDTFLMLAKRYAPKKAIAKAPKPGEALDPAAERRLKEMEAKAKARAEKNKGVVDLNVDEFADDEKKLQLIRPNMSELTEKDVERCRRVSVAFEENYALEMQQGLEMPGNRLKIEQYQALKDRDASARIYRNAKAALAQIARKAGGDEFQLPVLTPTHIPDETFMEWIIEIRNEDRDNMRRRGELKAAQKVLRQQESDLRQRFSKQRYWVINFCTHEADNAAELGPALMKELMEQSAMRDAVANQEVTEREAQAYEARKNDFQAFIIQEEKGTRAMFEEIAKWSFNAQLYVRRKLERKIKRRNSIMPEMSGNVKASRRRVNDTASSSSSAALGEIKEDGESEEAGVDEPDTEATSDHEDDNEGALVLAKGGGEESEESESDDEEPEADEEEEKKESFFGANLPSCHRGDIMKFLECARVYVKHEQHRNEIIAEVKQKKIDRDANDRRESAMFLAKVESEMVMGKTKAMIDAEVEEYNDMVQKRVERTNAEWDATIPPERPPHVRKEHRLSRKVFDSIKYINWLKVIFEQPIFYKALENLPTVSQEVFARDELIQFSTITAEIDPLIVRVQARIEREKDEEAAAMGLRSEADKKKAAGGRDRRAEKERMRLEAIEAGGAGKEMTREEREEAAEKKAQELMAGGLGEEAVKRMLRAEDAKRRQGERERAWLLAHPHRFIKYSDLEPAFCIECKVKMYEKWLEDHLKEEKEHHDGFEDELVDNYEDADEAVTAEHDAEYKARLVDFEADVQEYYIYQKKCIEDKKRFEEQMVEYNEKLLTYKQSGSKAPVKPMLRIRHPPQKADTAMYKYRRDLALNAPPEFVPMSFHYAKLCYVSPMGENVLPEDAVGGELMDDEDDESGVEVGNPDEELASTEEFPLGLRLRIWDRPGGFTAPLGPFLGQIVLNTDDLLRPPNGIRTYPLKNDVKLVERLKEAEEPVLADKVQGTITVQIKILKKDKKNDDKPLRWRLDIQRANRLACVDRLKKSAPYVEVFWCGPAVKDDNPIYFKRWIPVGTTNVKPKSIDPIFDKDQDWSVMDFPPEWSDLDIPHRGEGGEPLKGGGWCAQNQLPPPPDKTAGFGGFGKLKRLFRKVALAAIIMVRMKKNVERRNRKVVEMRLDARRELQRAENRERLCMAIEERRAKKRYLEEEQLRAAPYLERQIDFEKKWSKLCQYIQNAPKILARLRFMMGSDVDGGGTKIMTQDPTTKNLLDILSVPILYPEDEEFLVSQMQPLIGKHNINLTNIIDFSVHAARIYNLNGFTGIDDRVAIAVLQRYEGIFMLDYLKKEWLVLNNDGFRALLHQIVSGLEGLHEEGIIHRNFWEKCVIVRTPDHMYAEDPEPDPRKRYRPTQPNLRVADYWFLSNPRRTGCEYSMGRADWGNRGTAPPESLRGNTITDKADIWAFGVCVYHWATMGRTLPGILNVEDLKKDIPRKWGPWVHALLKMCLAQNPNVRASSSEVKLFLSKMLGN